MVWQLLEKKFVNVDKKLALKLKLLFIFKIMIFELLLLIRFCWPAYFRIAEFLNDRRFLLFLHAFKVVKCSSEIILKMHS